MPLTGVWCGVCRPARALPPVNPLPDVVWLSDPLPDLRAIAADTKNDVHLVLQSDKTSSGNRKPGLPYEGARGLRRPWIAVLCIVPAVVLSCLQSHGSEGLHGSVMGLPRPPSQER